MKLRPAVPHRSALTPRAAVARLRRVSRHLQVRVTAAATIAAIVLAVVGAVVFSTLFRQSLQNGTDDALRTIAANTTDSLTAEEGTPALTTVVANSRTTALQLIGPDGTVRQTVDPLSSLGRAVDDGRSVLATSSELAAAHTRQVLTTHHGARVLLAPFVRPDGTWILLVAGDLDQVEDASRNAETAFFVVVPVVVVLIAGGAWILSGAVLRPVERMRADAARLRDVAGAVSGPDATVHQPDSGDRIEALAVTLNGLIGDLTDAAERQRHLIADAGHELRTPLAVLSTELELADRAGRDAAYLHDAVSHAREEVDRLSTLAEDLLLLADAEHRVQRDSRLVSWAAVIDQAVRSHRAVAAERGITLNVDLCNDARVAGEASALRRLVDNLLGNALAVARSRIDLTLARTSDGAFEFAVTDDGPGFEPDFIPHAFERFRRADDDRHRTGPGGAGLGLAIVAAVAAAHGGRAQVGNTGSGARVSVVVPADR